MRGLQTDGCAGGPPVRCSHLPQEAGAGPLASWAVTGLLPGLCALAGACGTAAFAIRSGIVPCCCATRLSLVFPLPFALRLGNALPLLRAVVRAASLWLVARMPRPVVNQRVCSLP